MPVVGPPPGGGVGGGGSPSGTNASGTCRPTPAPVSGLSGAIQIALGFGHSCARRADLSVVCWGQNDRGQVGDGTTTGRVLPTPVPM